MTGEKAALAAVTNPRGVTGGIAEALAGADVFVGPVLRARCPRSCSR